MTVRSTTPDEKIRSFASQEEAIATGKAFRARREALGITGVAMEKALSLPTAYLSQFERGNKRSVPQGILDGIGRYLAHHERARARRRKTPEGEVIENLRPYLPKREHMPLRLPVLLGELAKILTAGRGRFSKRTRALAHDLAKALLDDTPLRS